jgi:peptide deformylase
MTRHLAPVPDDILMSKAAFVSSAKQAIEIIGELEQRLLTLEWCLGLAAPQIGIPFAVGVIRHNGVMIDLINPTVISREMPFVSRGEGCMSYPGRTFDVPRHKIVTIENFGVWPSALDSLPFESSMSDTHHCHLKAYNLPAESRLIPRTLVVSYDQNPESYGGVVCVGVQHECDHLQGVVLPKKEGSVEVKAVVEPAKVKPGRNDPCPCGSGQKFKKCCLGKGVYD